jgi:hypothetical protein
MAFGKATPWTDEMLDRAFGQIEQRFKEIEALFEEDEEQEEDGMGPLKAAILSNIPAIVAALKTPAPLKVVEPANGKGENG